MLPREFEVDGRSDGAPIFYNEPFHACDVLDTASSGMITRTPEKYTAFARHARSTYATTKILYLNCRRDIRMTGLAQQVIILALNLNSMTIRTSNIE